jgi:Ser/Thr protein kinase RdoA (MazF antagonist)
MHDSAASTIQAVAKAYGLGEVLRVAPGGGTASPKWAIQTPAGRFFVRTRPGEFAQDAPTQFDHSALRRLHRDGLAVPDVLEQPGGSTWIDLPEGRCEVLSWLEGAAFDPSDAAHLAGVGAFLARLHGVAFFPSGKEGFRREDHPDSLLPYYHLLLDLPEARGRGPELARLGRELERVRGHLGDSLYATLPSALTHGDFHPGNVRFGPSGVCAVYDFDYLSRQARVRDLCDALLFFAPRPRSTDALSDTSDIRSLTRSMTPDLEKSAAILNAYMAQIPLAHEEWRALPWLMRSRWLQIRLRGARKVPPEQKVAFVLEDLFDLPQWLDESGAAFFGELRRRA